MADPFDIDPPFQFRILDTVIEALRVHLAEVPPEQGAALFGHGALITTAMLDTSGEYSSSHWLISEDLSPATQAVERAGLGRFIGTVHSHPAGVINPSGGDRATTTSLLQANRGHLNAALVAIITAGAPFEASHIAVGEKHRMNFQLMSLDKNDQLIVIPVPAVVVSVADVLAGVGVSWNPSDLPLSTWLADPAGSAQRSFNRVVTTVLDGFRVATEVPGRAVYLPLNYPFAGPLVIERDEDGRRLVPLAWDAAIDARNQVPELGGADPFVPTADATDEAETSDEERTSRVTPIVGDLSSRHVLVFGAGSVGSRIAEDLVRAGVGELSIVDPDTVSMANMARSVYESTDVGRPKADVLRESLTAINPNLVVNKYRRQIGDLPEVGNILGEVDLVIGAVDDMPQQQSIAADVYRRGIPMVCSAMYKFAEAGEVVLALPAARTPCVRCSQGGSTRGSGHKPEADYGLAGRLTAHPGLGAAINLVSSFASLTALGILAGPESPAARAVVKAVAGGQTLGMISTVPDWDYFPKVTGEALGQIAPQSVWVQVTRDPECPVCAVPEEAGESVETAEPAAEALPEGPVVFD